jgi:hypothetical protein
MASKRGISERLQDEVLLCNLRERYATSFLGLYGRIKEQFVAWLTEDEEPFLRQLDIKRGHWQRALQHVRRSQQEAHSDVSLTAISSVSHLLLQTYYVDTLRKAFAYYVKLESDVNGAVFSAVFDYASGFGEIMLKTRWAEATINTPDAQKPARDMQTALEHAEHFWGATPPIEDSMALYQELREEQVRFHDLIDTDPTGKTLVRSLISRLEAHTQGQTVLWGRTLGLFEYQTAAFVFAGATFAEKAYQKLYPLVK